MKAIATLRATTGLLACGAALAWTEAGPTAAAGPRFSLGPLNLRAPATLAAKPQPPRRSEPEIMAAELALAARARELEIEAKFERAVIAPRPTRLDARGSDRFLRDIFEPEPVRVGNFTIATSITTAIKRRNPLCLINPYVIQATW